MATSLALASRKNVRSIPKAPQGNSHAFKKGDLVIVHTKPGLYQDKATGQWLSYPHDCSDPDQHVVGRILNDPYYPFANWEVATPDGSNQHASSWSYPSDMLTLLKGEDWVEKSSYKPGMTVHFMAWDIGDHREAWDLGDDCLRGLMCKGRIEAAHIEPGDWWVNYIFPVNANGACRVVNENQFEQRKRLKLTDRRPPKEGVEFMYQRYLYFTKKGWPSHASYCLTTALDLVRRGRIPSAALIKYPELKKMRDDYIMSGTYYGSDDW